MHCKLPSDFLLFKYKKLQSFFFGGGGDVGWGWRLLLDSKLCGSGLGRGWSEARDKGMNGSIIQ